MEESQRVKDYSDEEKATNADDRKSETPQPRVSNEQTRVRTKSERPQKNVVCVGVVGFLSLSTGHVTKMLFTVRVGIATVSLSHYRVQIRVPKIMLREMVDWQQRRS